jgi:hypothetical protein
MRRIYAIVALVTLLLLSGFSSAKEFVWRSVDTSVAARADGSLGVTETLTLGYTGGPFTFAFRDLPDRRLDGIANIAVSDGDRAYRQVDDEESAEPYTFSVFEHDGAQRVRWVYPATSDAERTFVLRYDVLGAVRRYDQFDEIWWSFVFPGREEVVEQATGHLALPAAVPVAQIEASAPDWPATIERAAGEVTVRGTDVPPSRELTLRVQFPKGVVGGAAPAWQAAADAQDAYDATTRPAVNVALSALAAGLLAVFGALVWGWRRRNRDPQPAGFAGAELPQAPDDLPPAVAAHLLGQAQGEALLGTLLDLANRGYLTLREERAGWSGKKTRVLAARTDAPFGDLAPFEQTTLEALGLSEPGATAVLTDQRSAIAKALGRLGAMYRAELIGRGYLDERNLARRRGGFVIGAIALAAGAALFIPAMILAERYSAWLPVVAGVVALAGVAWLIAAATIRGLTQAGADARARWEAFKRYLGRLRAERAPAGEFSMLVPYGVAFGHAGRLTETYSAIGEPLPVWFYPVLASHSPAAGGSAGTGGSGSVLALNDFSQNFLGSISSASSGLSASAGGGVSGAGGASGGGGGGAG